MNLDALKSFTQNQLANDKTGHALDHLERVEKLALEILSTLPQANRETVLAVVWLHEAFDDKLASCAQPSQVLALLEESQYSPKEIDNIMHSIQHLSFSKNFNNQIVLSLEGQIAQDADRLDAMGAIGIARTFYYGGAHGHLLYSHQDLTPIQTLEAYRQDANCLHHFNVKLLKLLDLLNTEEGRKIGQRRHQFMLAFLDQFNKEIQSH